MDPAKEDLENPSNNVSWNRLSLILPITLSLPPVRLNTSTTPQTNRSTSEALALPISSKFFPQTSIISSFSPISSVFPDVHIPDPEYGVPETTNELDRRTKAELLKKARKLSRVFGDVPGIERNINIVHRRSSSSTSTSSSKPSLICDIHSSEPHIQSLHQIDEQALNTVLESDTLSIESITPSLHESSFEKNQVRMRRNKMAKLTRHFGENVPPHLIAGEILPRPPPAALHSSIPRRSSYDTLTSPLGEIKAGKRSLTRCRSWSMLELHPQSKYDIGYRDFEQRHDDNFGSRKRLSLGPDNTFAKRTQMISPELPSNTYTPPFLLRGQVLIRQDKTGLGGSDSVDTPGLRKRMDKLANFFGVGYTELSAPYQSREIIATERLEVKMDINVGSRRFWDFGRRANEPSGSNMDDVVHRLRGLKAR